ncbi:6-bladed beta-propeller [Desulfosporosinus sp. Sb-LF]|nr:6-bladed beta-propeller [Desulfosporosinus sp. Sb-LF]
MLATFIAVTCVFSYFFLYKDTNLSAQVQRVVNSKAQPAFNQMIYGGFGPDALNKPMDVAVINQFVYVTDTNNKRVQVFDLGGTPFFKFGKEGEGKGEFKFPYGIAGDKQGQVYVSDLYNGCISVFDSKGKFIKYFAEKDPKETIIEAPGGLRIVGDKLYVTDIKKSKVLVFDLEGKLLKEIGSLGQKPGQFQAPNALTLDKDGNLYVVDTGNQRVEVFDKDYKYVRSINGSLNGAGDSIFVNPRGIGIDSRGILYVVSNLTHFVYGFDLSDKDKKLFTFGGNGESNTQFSLPNGLFVDQNDNVYITDSSNQRVAVYK